MKLTFKKIIDSVPAFKELQKLVLPPSITVGLYKLSKELEKELEAYNDLSKGIYLANKIPQTEFGFDLKSADEKSLAQVLKHLEELLSTPVELKDYQLDMSIFEENNTPISTEMLLALEWLFKKEPEAEESETEELKEVEVPEPKKRDLKAKTAE